MTIVPLSDAILDANRDVWDAMQSHRFVREIAEDRLQPAVFRRYLAYENAFVETAITIFGYLLVKAPGLAEQQWIIGVLKALSEEQIAYFRAAFDELGMGEPEWREIALPASVLAFEQGMLAIAAHGAYVDGIAAMFAAEWMYWHWCVRAAAKPSRTPVIRRWVELHTAEEFADQARWLKQQLDREGASLTPGRAARVSAMFRRALVLEIDFHSAPFDTASVDRVTAVVTPAR